MPQGPASRDSNTEKHVESTKPGAGDAGAQKAAGECYSKDAHADSLKVLKGTDAKAANTPSFLPDCQITITENSTTQTKDSPKPPTNADTTIAKAPTESDKTSDKTADKPADNSAKKQAELTKLNLEAITPGTALYNYIQEYKKGAAANDAAGIPNEHGASPHGFPETSPDRQTIPGLQNSDVVRPGLFRGANPGGSGDGAPWSPEQLITNLVNLKYDHNVNTVVSFEEKNDTAKPDNNVNGKIDAEQQVCKELGINFYNVPLDQSYTGQRLADQGQNFLDIVNKPGTVAYIHCREGIDRTGEGAALAAMNPPKDANGVDVVAAKSAQQAAQDQVNHGYGQNKRLDYTNFFIPGADYTQADAQKKWTEKKPKANDQG